MLPPTSASHSSSARGSRRRAGGGQARGPHARVDREADLQRLAGRAERALHAAGRRDGERHRGRDLLGPQAHAHGGRDGRARRTRGAGRMPAGRVVRPAQRDAQADHRACARQVGPCVAAGGEHRGHAHRADVRRGLQVEVVEVEHVSQHRPRAVLRQLAEECADRVVACGGRARNGVDERAVGQRQVVGRRREGGRPPRKLVGDRGHPSRSRTTTGISRSVLAWYSSYAGQTLRHRAPQLGLLVGRRSARAGCELVGLDLDVDVRIGAEVVVPRGRLVGPALGRDDQEIVAVAPVDQRRRALLAGAAAGRGDEQHGRAVAPVVALLAVGLDVAPDMFGSEEHRSGR